MSRMWIWCKIYINKNKTKQKTRAHARHRKNYAPTRDVRERPNLEIKSRDQDCPRCFNNGLYFHRLNYHHFYPPSFLVTLHLPAFSHVPQLHEGPRALHC